MPQETGPAASAPRKLKIRRAAAWLVLTLLFALLFYRYGMNVPELLRLMVNINYIPLIFWSVVFIVGVLILDTLSQWLAFNWFNCRVSLRDIFYGRGAFMLLSSVAYVFGQAGMAYYMNRKKQVPIGEASDTVIFLFYLEFFGMILLSAIGIVLLWPNLQIGAIVHNLTKDNPHPALEAFFNSPRGLVAVVLFFAAVCLAYAGVMIVMRSQWWMARLPWINKLGLGGAFRKATLGKSLALLFLKWLMALHQMVITIVIFHICRIEIPWREVIAYMPLSILISAIPITPMRLGTTQWSWVIFFAHYVDRPMLVAFSLVWQFILNIIRILVGAIFLPATRRDIF